MLNEKDFNTLLNALRPHDKNPWEHCVYPHVTKNDISDLYLIDTVAFINFFIDRYNLAIEACDHRERLLHVYRQALRDEECKKENNHE
jgi:hypothetical protein